MRLSKNVDPTVCVVSHIAGGVFIPNQKPGTLQCSGYLCMHRSRIVRPLARKHNRLRLSPCHIVKFALKIAHISPRVCASARVSVTFACPSARSSLIVASSSGSHSIRRPLDRVLICTAVGVCPHSRQSSVTSSNGSCVVMRHPRKAASQVLSLLAANRHPSSGSVSRPLSRAANRPG